MSARGLRTSEPSPFVVPHGIRPNRPAFYDVPLEIVLAVTDSAMKQLIMDRRDAGLWPSLSVETFLRGDQWFATVRYNDEALQPLTFALEVKSWGVER